MVSNIPYSFCLWSKFTSEKTQDRKFVDKTLMDSFEKHCERHAKFLRKIAMIERAHFGKIGVRLEIGWHLWFGKGLRFEDGENRRGKRILAADKKRIRQMDIVI